MAAGALSLGAGRASPSGAAEGEAELALGASGAAGGAGWSQPMRFSANSRPPANTLVFMPVS